MNEILSNPYFLVLIFIVILAIAIPITSPSKAVKVKQEPRDYPDSETLKNFTEFCLKFEGITKIEKGEYHYYFDKAKTKYFRFYINDSAFLVSGYETATMKGVCDEVVRIYFADNLPKERMFKSLRHVQEQIKIGQKEFK